MNPYFDFALQADEAEQLYRLLNLLENLGHNDLADHERDFVIRFRERVLDFTRRHPV